MLLIEYTIAGDSTEIRVLANGICAARFHARRMYIEAHVPGTIDGRCTIRADKPTVADWQYFIAKTRELFGVIISSACPPLEASTPPAPALK